MWRPTRRLALGLAAALLIAAAVWGAARLLHDPVDACLDAGGSWHYDVGECSLTETYEGPR